MQSLAALVPMETSIMAETLTSADEVVSTIETGQTNYPTGLDDFTVRMSVNDARNLVELLKLAVATRMGESAKESLSEVLSRLARAYSQVNLSIHWQSIDNPRAHHIYIYSDFDGYYFLEGEGSALKKIFDFWCM